MLHLSFFYWYICNMKNKTTKKTTKLTLRPLTEDESTKFAKLDAGIVITITELIKRFPNDMDLGREVRRLLS